MTQTKQDLRRQRDVLLEACKNTLVSIQIMSMPQLDDNVAGNGEILKLIKDSLEAAITKVGIRRIEKDGNKCNCGFKFSGSGEFRNCKAFILYGESGVICPVCGKTYIGNREVIIKVNENVQ